MDLVLSVTVDYTEFNEKSLCVRLIFGYSICPRTAIVFMRLERLVCWATLLVMEVRISINIYAKTVSLVKMLVFCLNCPCLSFIVVIPQR